MIGFFIAILSGILMSVQGVFNTAVTKESSLWSTNTFVQFSAFLVCLGVWALTDRSSFANIMKVQPKYLLLGGVIGAFITCTVVYAMNSLGPAKAVMVIVVAQILMAYLIEVLGAFGVTKQAFSVQKLVGILVAITGIILFKWK